MSESHGKASARLTQAQATQSPENSMDHSGGNGGQSHHPASCGEFPERGRFSSVRWANMLGCSRKTIERHVETNNVPYRKIGDMMVIDTSDFWAALPVTHPKQARKARGGSRKKE